MTPRLSDDLRKAIEEHGGEPVYIVDAQTNASYVVIRAEQYESLAALLADGGNFDPREMYPLIARSAASAGWNDPEMDVYNDYDAHKKP
jgi:hypothetical protein